MANQKYYLTIPSKDYYELYIGKIKEIMPFTETTPRGKQISGWLGKIDNNLIYNVFLPTKTEAKAFITYINNKNKKKKK